MNKVVISPFSQKLRNGKQNPKNFPHWKNVVNQLRKNGYKIIQVGVDGEEEIGADIFLKNLSIQELEKVILDADVWASVDNFMNHLGSNLGKRGIVVWSRSNPNIFGYPNNVNLLKDVSNLRSNQFNIWEQCEYDENAFVHPDVVALAISETIS